MRRWLEPSFVLVAVLSLVGCSDDKGGEKKAAPKHEHPPEPHGGEVVEVGEEVAHLEMIHDHVGGKVTVYVLGADLKTPIAIETPVVNVKGKDGTGVQFSLTAVNPGADGKADTWKGEHEALKTDPWDGRIRVKIDGKTYNSDLEPAGPHTHGEEFVPPSK